MDRNAQDEETDDRRDDPSVDFTADSRTAQSIVDNAEAHTAHAQHSEGEGDEGLLRTGFSDRDESFSAVSWDEFRAEFEEKDLALLYSTDGSPVKGDRPLALLKREDVED